MEAQPQSDSPEPVGFASRSELHPDRVAVVDPDGATITYGELSRLVNQLSHGLRRLGIERGDAVALATHNHHLYFAVAIATEQIGVHAVPINWHLTSDEMAYIVENSESRLAIVGSGLEEPMAGALDQVGLAADRRFSIADASGFRPLAEVTADQPATLPEGRLTAMPMLYTSGTTGRPKGVRRPVFEVPPEQFLGLLMPMYERRGMGPGEGVFFSPAPLYHAAPGAHAGASLHFGYTVVLMDHWDSEEALGLIERHRATHTHLAPIHLQRWLALDDEIRARYDLSSLRWVIHAGAPCPVHVKQRMIEWLGPVLFEYYAGSEGAFTSVTAEEWLEHPGTVGHVSSAMGELKILDEADGTELPPGEVGLIYTRNPMLAFEYHRDPEKTAAARREDEFFTLGDMGYVDEDGWLFLVDRRTDMINSGGVNVYPAEIEERLSEHPAVIDCAVVGVADEDWGQSVAAVVVPRAEAQAGAELAVELDAHCHEGLAGFKCPREIEFRAELPRLPSGKLQRRVLREELASRKTTEISG